MVSQHQNLRIYSSKDPKKVPESTNKLGAQEALRPYLGAKEAKAHRALSQISLPTESILYKEGRERCRCPVQINGQWTTTRTSTIESIPDICQSWYAWYATALFRPVKSLPKRMKIHGKIGQNFAFSVLKSNVGLK